MMEIVIKRSFGRHLIFPLYIVHLVFFSVSENNCVYMGGLTHFKLSVIAYFQKTFYTNKWFCYFKRAEF